MIWLLQALGVLAIAALVVVLVTGIDESIERIRRR